MSKAIECGLSSFIRLPADPNLSQFNRLAKNKLKGVKYEPMTVLASLLNNSEDAFKLNERPRGGRKEEAQLIMELQ
jgi:hypothetical protein